MSSDEAKMSTTTKLPGTCDSLNKFLVAYYKMGSIEYTWRPDGTFHTPNPQIQLEMYLRGYINRDAGLMDAIVLHIHTNDIAAYIPILAKMWNDTYSMCSEMKAYCTLRHCLLNMFLEEIHVSKRMTKDDFGNEELYPPSFTKELFRRLALLEEGKYPLLPTYLKFDEPKTWKKEIKSWDSQKTHDQVLQKLEIKRAEAAKNGGIRDVDHEALEAYITSFPNGCNLVQTSPEKLLCGLDSICKSMEAQLSTMVCPEVDQLQEIVESEDYLAPAGNFVVEGEKVNRNLFRGDELARIAQTWGELVCGESIQLGYITNEGVPHLFSCPNPEAKVLWIHNDDAEAQFEGMGVKAIGHWSGLAAVGN